MRIFRRTGVLIAIVILSILCVSTPIFAWTGAYTGWCDDFSSGDAHFSMFIVNYYQNDTSTSTDLGWSYFYIDNWDTNPGSSLQHLENEIRYGVGLKDNYHTYPDINPGDYYVGMVDLGSKTYSKSQAILVASSAMEYWDVLCGLWRMNFWENLTQSSTPIY